MPIQAIIRIKATGVACAREVEASVLMHAVALRDLRVAYSLSRKQYRTAYTMVRQLQEHVRGFESKVNALSESD